MRLYSHYSFLLRKHGYFTDYPLLRTDAKIRRNMYDCCFLDLFPFPMKILSDLLAVILFFITYTVTKNIIWATAVALAAGVAQAVFTYVKYKKLETMQWVSLILIVVLGGATILLKDKRFIMWKPTALFWFGALALAVGQVMGKNSLKAVMGKEIELPAPVWRRLTFAWIVYLLFMGVANIIVFKTFTEAQWVNYKLFGSTALMIVFIIGQILYLSRHLPQENN